MISRVEAHPLLCLAPPPNRLQNSHDLRNLVVIHAGVVDELLLGVDDSGVENAAFDATGNAGWFHHGVILTAKIMFSKVVTSYTRQMFRGVEMTAANESEDVVLLDEEGTAIGTASKASVHGPDTPLHLAFSCYALNEQGEVLITRRALSKAS